MEPFFYDDIFCSDIEDLTFHLDIHEENIDDLPDDWSVEVQGTTLEKMFVLDIPFVVNAIMNSTDYFEDRFPEDSERVIKEIEEAIKQSVDIEKLNNLLPSLYYPNGTTEVITKADIADYF